MGEGMTAPLRFADAYRRALRQWTRSRAMWMLAGAGFVPTLLLVKFALAPGAFVSNLPPLPVEVVLVTLSAAFAAAVPLAPVVAFAMAVALWLRAAPREA